MARVVAQKCSMCKSREMVSITSRTGGLTSFFWCPNCDNPNGVTPGITYDGAGPKKP
jgi:hypothetical protein